MLWVRSRSGTKCPSNEALRVPWNRVYAAKLGDYFSGLRHRINKFDHLPDRPSGLLGLSMFHFLMRGPMHHMQVMKASTIFLGSLLIQASFGQECLSDVGGSNSQDCKAPEHLTCDERVQEGQCNSNQDYMFQNCASRCLFDENLGGRGYFTSNSTENIHLKDDCIDIDDDCEMRADEGECNSSAEVMHTNCAKTCMICFDTK